MRRCGRSKKRHSTTRHAQIRVFCGPAPPPGILQRMLEELERAAGERDAERAVFCLQEMVPSYTPSAVVLREAQVPRGHAVGA